MYKICIRECGISREHRTNWMRIIIFLFLLFLNENLMLQFHFFVAVSWRCARLFPLKWHSNDLSLYWVWPRLQSPIVCCNIFASLPNKCVQIDRILLALRSTVRIASNTKFIIHNIYASEPQFPRQIHWSRVHTVICTTKSPIVSVAVCLLYRVVSPGIAQASEIVLPQYMFRSIDRSDGEQQMNTKPIAKQASANKIHGEKLKKYRPTIDDQRNAATSNDSTNENKPTTTKNKLIRSQWKQ